MRKLLKKHGLTLDKIVADDLRSYGAAACELGISDRHEHGRWRNNLAENSQQPTRRSEIKMPGIASVGSMQRILSTHAAAYKTANNHRHLISARTRRAFRGSAVRHASMAAATTRASSSTRALASIVRQRGDAPIALQFRSAITFWIGGECRTIKAVDKKTILLFNLAVAMEFAV